MRWADALANSQTCRARRKLISTDDEQEPNVLLIDPKFSSVTPKAFHVPDDGGSYPWTRVKLRFADNYDDWEPEKPINAVDEIAQLDGDSDA